MFELRESDDFHEWVAKLRDDRAVKRIFARLARVEAGMFGDVKYFDGIGEMRIDHGPGYRLYFVKRGKTIIILLCCGDTSSQSRDITWAKALAQEI